MDDAKAREHIARARSAMRDGDYKRAKYILERTKHPLATKLLAELEADRKNSLTLLQKQEEKAKETKTYEHALIWRLDPTVSPLALKVLFTALLLSFMGIPSVSLIMSGNAIYIPLAIVGSIPLILLGMGICYIGFRFYWGCVGALAFLVSVISLATILLLITGAFYMPDLIDRLRETYSTLLG